MTNKEGFSLFLLVLMFFMGICSASANISLKLDPNTNCIAATITPMSYKNDCCDECVFKAKSAESFKARVEGEQANLLDAKKTVNGKYYRVRTICLSREGSQGKNIQSLSVWAKVSGGVDNPNDACKEDATIVPRWVRIGYVDKNHINSSLDDPFDLKLPKELTDKIESIFNGKLIRNQEEKKEYLLKELFIGEHIGLVTIVLILILWLIISPFILIKKLKRSLVIEFDSRIKDHISSMHPIIKSGSMNKHRMKDQAIKTIEPELTSSKAEYLAESSPMKDGLEVELPERALKKNTDYLKLYNLALKNLEAQTSFLNEPGVRRGHIVLKGEMDFLGFIEPRKVHFKQDDKGWFLIVDTGDGKFCVYPHFMIFGGIEPAKYAFKFQMDSGVEKVEKPAFCKVGGDGWILIEPGILHYK